MDYKPHLSLVHSYWTKHLRLGDVVIDATCGNGYDSLFLSKLILTPFSGWLHCIDMQKQAIEHTHQRLFQSLPCELFNRVSLYHQSHETLPKSAPALIAYNLGYLPGSDKQITTTLESTITSLDISVNQLKINGLITIVCYPGHAEGLREEKAIEQWSYQLPKDQYEITWTKWPHKNRHPSVLLIKVV